jgi:hypothetical protein
MSESKSRNILSQPFQTERGTVFSSDGHERNYNQGNLLSARE